MQNGYRINRFADVELMPPTGMECKVYCPAQIARVRDEDRVISADVDTRGYRLVLNQFGYRLRNETPCFSLWQFVKEDTNTSGYVVVFYRDFDGYTIEQRYGATMQAFPCFLFIDDIEILLAFFYHYHLPLHPLSLEEEKLFIRNGYEYYGGENMALATQTDEEALYALYHLEAACDRAFMLSSNLAQE